MKQLFGLSFALMALLGGKAFALDRTDSLINSFEVLCTLESPDFDRIDRRATAMQLKVQEDINRALGPGTVGRSKSWIATLTTGPHQWVVSDVKSPTTHEVDCGISAPDADSVEFKKKLIEQLKLGDPTSFDEEHSAHLNVTIWQNAFGPHSALRLMDGPTGNTRGVMVFYVYHPDEGGTGAQP